MATKSKSKTATKRTKVKDLPKSKKRVIWKEYEEDKGRWGGVNLGSKGR
jgi:hypothetical protein